MDPSLVEGEARYILGELGEHDPTRPPTARATARRLLGGEAVVKIRGLVGSAAELARDGDRRVVVVRAGLPPERERWCIFHELGEWRLEQMGYREEDIEQVADAIAAACVLPRESFLTALREYGRRFHRVARTFVTSETAAALRLGEVTGEPVAVVAPATVRVRGDEFAWPSESTLRDLARAKRLPRGLAVKRVALKDDARRRVLLAG